VEPAVELAVKLAVEMELSMPVDVDEAEARAGGNSKTKEVVPHWGVAAVYSADSNACRPYNSVRSRSW
jgi:hypothetical protein